MAADSSVTSIWDHVSSQVSEELDQLISQSSAMTTALSNVASIVSTVPDGEFPGYVVTAPTSIRDELEVPEGLSHSQTTGGGWGAGLVGPLPPLPQGAAGAMANEFVKYSPPSAYDWFDTADHKFYKPSYKPAPNFTTPEPQFPVYPQPSVFADDVETEIPEYLELPEFTLQESTSPVAPELRDIVLPEAPDISIPDFTAERPDFQSNTLSVDLNFSDAAYASALLGALQSTSSIWLSGNHALTTTIWDAIQSAAEARGLKVRNTLRNWAIDSWRSRGWPADEQFLADRQEEAQQVGQNVHSNVRRDAVIQKESLLIQSMRAAIQTGVALEQVLITLWDQANQRILEAAVALVEFANATLQLRIKEFEAQSQFYRAEAAVSRAQVEAEGEKLTLSQAQIEAEKERGKIDQNKIAVYEAQESALDALVDEYEARAQAWVAQEAQNDAIIEQFRGLVEAYQQQIAKYVSKWRIYQTRIKQLTAKPTFENTLMQAFAEQIRAAAMEVDGEQKKSATKLEQATEQIDRMQTSLTKQRADMRNALNTMLANSADARVYLQRHQAGLAYTRVYNTAGITPFQLAQMENDDQAQYLSRKLQFAAKKHDTAAQQGSVALNAASRAYSQLGSAAFSTINVRMGANGSLSDTWNWQTIYNTG